MQKEIKDQDEKLSPSSKLNIFQRLSGVMSDVNYIQKSDKAAKGLPYKFVSHDQVTGAIHGAFVKWGIVSLTDIIAITQEGNRTSVEVLVSFVNIDMPDDRTSIKAFGYGIDPQDKGPGKAISYATKYAYLKCLMLETGDDPERDNINYEPEKISDGQADNIRMLLNGHEDIKEALLKWTQKKAISDINAASYETVIQTIKTRIQGKENGTTNK